MTAEEILFEGMLCNYYDDHMEAMENSWESGLFKELVPIAWTIKDALCHNRKLLVFGNGGSAVDAMHFAAELVGRFEIRHRRSFPVLALTENTATITSIGNDFNFNEIFSKQIGAYCIQSDVVMGLSTSGNSQNVVRALECATGIGAKTIGIRGNAGWAKIDDFTDYLIKVPTSKTARVQEITYFMLHILAGLIETMWEKNYVKWEDYGVKPK